MDYTLNDKRYSLSYLELAAEHSRLSAMTDADFVDALPAAIHLACVLCWFKELPASIVLADDGVIHQLAHLLHIPDEPLVDLQAIRRQFDEQLALAP